jgi:transposase
MITTKQLRKVTSMLDDIVKSYKKDTVNKKRNWRTYEQQLYQRLQTAFDELRPLVFEATEELAISNANRQGMKSTFSLEEKVLMLLLKHLFGKSNRNMASMTVLFSWLTGISVSYKTIERLYSDESVILALHNLHMLILDKKEIEAADCAGDGTGYALTIKKHYASYAQVLKDAAKKQTNKGTKKSLKKKKFVYSFVILDVATKMHIGFGTSFKSEREAYNRAIEMVKKTGIKVQSMRLDRYYSAQMHVKELQELFGDLKVFLIPKKDATVRGSLKWSQTMKEFITNTFAYLKEYYKRNQSESGFSEDKKRIGWKLGQKREDRIDTANILTSLWHNLYWLA